MEAGKGAKAVKLKCGGKHTAASRLPKSLEKQTVSNSFVATAASTLCDGFPLNSGVCFVAIWASQANGFLPLPQSLHSQSQKDIKMSEMCSYAVALTCQARHRGLVTLEFYKASYITDMLTSNS